MKILLVTRKSSIVSQTGIGTQVRETAAALERKGCEVAIIGWNGSSFENIAGCVLSDEEVRSLSKNSDVAHLINTHRPLVSAWRRFKSCPVVGSSVYWSGWERWAIARKSGPFSLKRLHSELSYIRGMFPFGNDMRGVDLFLPNSNAEGECIKRSYRMSPNAYYSAVPNGFNVPKFDLSELKRPKAVPESDYLVVPAVFANRKNQLGLIRALRGHDINIVFMGGVLAQDYYGRCITEASDGMRFIGYVQNGSKEYWSILRYARCACLPSDCETPGIAMIEAAYAGCRPVITKFGGTAEYYGFDAEYFDPRSSTQILDAINRGWHRGRMEDSQAKLYSRFTWDYCADITIQAYRVLLRK